MLRPIVYMLGEAYYLGLLVYRGINVMRKVMDVLSCINLKDDTIINKVIVLRFGLRLLLIIFLHLFIYYRVQSNPDYDVLCQIYCIG